jgi:hypothetical protein
MVQYLRKFLNNHGFPQKAQTPCSLIMKRALRPLPGLNAQFESVGGSEQAKHVDLRVHFVHEARTAGHFKLRKVNSR